MVEKKRENYTLNDVREQTYKRRDAWWTVWLVDPVAARLVVPLANHTRITPNQISVLAFLFGLFAAGFFLQGDPMSLAWGALFFHLSFVLDCMDGKIARLKGTGSVFGMWLDYMLDRFRVVICSVALMSGQWLATEQTSYLFLALFIIFLDSLRYMDALQLYKLRREMKKRVRRGRMKEEPIIEEEENIQGEMAASAEEISSPSVDLNQTFKRRFQWYLNIRDWLEQHRIRPHLFSGIEFQMFIFIIGPLTGLILEMVVVSAVLLLTFELAIIYKLWLSTKDMDRELTVE
ncbi:CDP-alcohol phosphatidyltransferase family protein [Desmospora activa]|uniref:CDP-alcohol phosphatidyltransferase-like enzyme n=1 Tax=Desmospora activa DSM 45169 TaxID=1121389 RepID=A0A2T4Z437_9BACL|nr:CDP-alcohol phosphatidyltransferase family protein [Desmospora activa]PTM56658.1 CDP-alcohol phosphatidyltransferase-like enzyme [Desmospora activa DSM 45169]